MKDREFRKLCAGDYSHRNMITVIALSQPELTNYIKELPAAEFPQYGFGYTLPEHRIVNKIADELVGILPYMILKTHFGGANFNDNMYAFAQELIKQIKGELK